MTADARPTSSSPESPGPPRRRSIWTSPYLWAFVAGALMLTLIRPLLRFEPPPPPVLFELPEFSLVDQSGDPFGTSDLEGRVYVASFFFTRCRSFCPAVMQAVRKLQDRYEAEGVDGVLLVSITVDPRHDTPDRLREYARSLGANPRRWVFLTGPEPAVHHIVEEGFKTPMGLPESPAPGIVEVAHTGKLVLVDPFGRIRGYYDHDEQGLDEVFHRSLHVLKTSGPS